MSPLSTKLSHISTPASSISEEGSSSGRGNHHHHHETSTPQSSCCAKCLANKAQTHLIEIINYPALHHAHTRHHVLHKGEYDAVLLVYDVGNRASFEHIKRLHAEIPLTAHHRRWRKAPSTPRRKSSSSSTGLARRPSMQKRGSLFSLFAVAATPPNGKEAVGVADGDSAHMGGSEGLGPTVIAVVGNKCDLDEPPEGITPTWREGEEQEERVGLDGEVEDIDYARALFGYPPLRDEQGEESSSSESSSSAPSTPNDARPSRPTLGPPASRSSDTLDEFLLVGRSANMVQDVTRTEISGSTTSSGSQSAVHGGRQVSNVDGEGLALELSTQVPFFETSARTGENVEEVFEAVARAVLKEMGKSRATNDELTKNCPHRNNIEEGYTGRKHSFVGDVAPKLSLPVFGPAPVANIDEDKNDRCAQPLQIKGLHEEKAATVLEQAVETQPVPRERQRVRRQESIVEKMKKMFMIIQPPMAESLAV